MNKGLIYKVKFSENNTNEYYIKLENIIEINKKEYNVFIDSNIPSATLISVDTAFTANVDLMLFVGKKVDFEIDSKSNKIKAIEYDL